MDDTRVSKSATELVVGDWLAPGELLDGAAEVLHTLTYRPARVTARDNDKQVHLVVREQGKAAPWGHIVGGDNVFDLATEADLAELREKVERAQRIADIRDLADFLEAHPSVPMSSGRMQVSPGLDYQDGGDVWNSGAEGVAEVRRVAEVLGEKVREDDPGRTEVTKRFGSFEYCLIAWHKDGRPAEPVAPVTGRLIPPVDVATGCDGDHEDRSDCADA